MLGWAPGLVLPGQKCKVGTASLPHVPHMALRKSLRIPMPLLLAVWDPGGMALRW